MLYREIIAVCSQIHTKHINTLCGQNVELLNVKLAVHIVTNGRQKLWEENPNSTAWDEKPRTQLSESRQVTHLSHATIPGARISPSLNHRESNSMKSFEPIKLRNMSTSRTTAECLCLHSIKTCHQDVRGSRRECRETSMRAHVSRDHT